MRERKRILLDARCIGPTPHGFARYIGCLARGLTQREFQERLPYEIVPIVGPDTPPQAFRGFHTVQAKSRFLAPGELRELPRILASEKADLYHSPTFSSLLGAPCPWIITIHDLNHLHFGGMKEKLYYRLLLRPFARKAAAVATVSEFSRSELAPWLGRQDIEIVPNAIEPDFGKTWPEVPLRCQAMGVKAKRFFLSLTNTKPHKNLRTLIEAYRAYRGRATDPWPLLVSVQHQEQEPGLFQLGALTDAESKGLIAAAGAMVFPSLYEGFGLPPVEAASAGIPVIVSDIPPHREALADLQPPEVLWISPTDTEAWAAGLERAQRGEIASPSESTRKRILDHFSVSRLGESMDRIYRRVLGLEKP